MTRPSSPEPSDPRPLHDVRRDIDAVDRELLRLLGERRRHSIEAAHAKSAESDWFRDVARESQLVADRIDVGGEFGLDPRYVTSLFRGVLDDSLRLQQEHYGQYGAEQPDGIRVAFQGIEGSYSHLAAERYLAHRTSTISHQGYTRFKDAVHAVETGTADLAVLPIENTTSGAINEVYDLLLEAQLSIVGEVVLEVDHCLLGLPGAELGAVNTVFCHPQTVLQCSQFLSEHPKWKIEYFADTALSGRKIRDEGEPRYAAIASEEASRLLGLTVLKRGIANQKSNFTRFLVAARKALDVDPRVPCKTSIVLMTGNEAGSLLEVLAVFRDAGINLTKLSSRPILENPWEEMFYLDFEGSLGDEIIRDALDEVTRRAAFIKLLGSYPSLQLPNARPRRNPAERLAPTEAVVEETAAPALPRGYRLASRAHKPEDTRIRIRGVELGGDELVVIAGPCAVESHEQILACARAVKAAGGHILRGGCFKPRTSPYSFQGLGYEGIDMLVDAGARVGLPVVTEVLTPEDVARVAESVDILQVGARNMQNFSLLSEVGRARRPVMLKRGMSASLEELLQAAEYILAAGNQQVFLCERGIRTFETSTRNTLDLSAVPALRGRTHLPVIVDPSHAAGQRDLVPALTRASEAVGAHAVMVEIHPEPEKALSDGPQALRFHEFDALMKQLERLAGRGANG